MTPWRCGERQQPRATNGNGRRGENPGGRSYLQDRGECQGDSLSSLLYNDGISVRALHYGDFRMRLGHDAAGCRGFSEGFLFRVKDRLALGYGAFKWKVARGNEGGVRAANRAHFEVGGRMSGEQVTHTAAESAASADSASATHSCSCRGTGAAPLGVSGNREEHDESCNAYHSFHGHLPPSAMGDHSTDRRAIAKPERADALC